MTSTILEIGGARSLDPTVVTATSLMQEPADNGLSTPSIETTQDQQQVLPDKASVRAESPVAPGTSFSGFKEEPKEAKGNRIKKF